jgi:orotate phosphoribosyltransferase-like protein
MFHTFELREKAEQLRKMGYSLEEISSQLKISKSTASLWLRNVVLTDGAKVRLAKRSLMGQLNAVRVKKTNKKRLLKGMKDRIRLTLTRMNTKEKI